MEGLDQDREPGKAQGIPTAAIIAVLASIGIIAALGWTGYHLMPREGGSHSSGGDVAALYFPTELADAKFSGAVPAGWRVIGSLPLDSTGGLRPIAGGQTAGGGIVLSTPISPDEPFAFEVELKASHLSDNLVAQIFVSTSGDFSEDRATSSHELLWSLRGKSQQVVLDGSVLPTTAAALNPGTIRVRIIMNREQAVVESNGKRLWAGPHGLAASPRAPGVRFIRSAPDPKAAVQIQSAKVLEP